MVVSLVYRPSQFDSEVLMQSTKQIFSKINVKNKKSKNNTSYFTEFSEIISRKTTPHGEYT